LGDLPASGTLSVVIGVGTASSGAASGVAMIARGVKRRVEARNFMVYMDLEGRFLIK
jgi:hypothetical protein